MRGRLTVGAGGAACALLSLCGVARAEGVRADPLRAVVFHTAAAPEKAAVAAPTAPAEPLIKIVIQSADGREETRMVTRAELDRMTGRASAPASAPTIAAETAPSPRPARSVAATIAAVRGQTPRRLAASDPWVALDRDKLETLTRTQDDDADTVPGLLVQAAPTPPTRSRRKEGRTVLGVRDGRAYRDQGRLYIYAAGKGGGVGLNVTDHGEGAGWSGDGVSYDRGGFAGQRSAGVGWRQGDLSTSLGWVHAKTNLIGTGIFRAPAEKDDRVALTLSWRPSPR